MVLVLAAGIAVVTLCERCVKATLFQRNSMLIRHIHLTEHLGDLFALHSSLAVLFHLLPLNIVQQLQLFLLSYLNLLQPNLLVLLDLVCDDSGPLVSLLLFRGWRCMQGQLRSVGREYEHLWAERLHLRILLYDLCQQLIGLCRG